jgi:hypothetical protein
MGKELALTEFPGKPEVRWLGPWPSGSSEPASSHLGGSVAQFQESDSRTLKNVYETRKADMPA